MNTPDSLNTQSKNLLYLILNNWDELDDSLKTKLKKIWNVLTYKWQLQILFNLPFLLWWALDKFFDFTSDLVSFYKNNNITPLIESDFSSSEKLDSVYSFLENDR